MKTAELHRERLMPLFDYLQQQDIRVHGAGSNAQGPCLVCGSSDAASYSRTKNVFHCFSCESGGDVLTLHQRTHGISFAEAARDLGALVESDSPFREKRPGKAPMQPVEAPQPQRWPDHARRLWEASEPLRGTVGEQYLLARGCLLPPEDGDLRFHPSVRHESSHVGPALLGLITDAVTRERMGLHRTWVTPAGKADLQKAKMALGPKKGGVIRLWPDECVTYGLAIAEGIETALSMAHDYKPLWSVIDAGNMAAFPCLGGIETLVIGADNDPAGLRAAQQCADRWAAAGVDVRVIVPDVPGADWNDVREAA